MLDSKERTVYYRAATPLVYTIGVLVNEIGLLVLTEGYDTINFYDMQPVKRRWKLQSNSTIDSHCRTEYEIAKDKRFIFFQSLRPM
jgi:hypothetical protein